MREVMRHERPTGRRVLIRRKRGVEFAAVVDDFDDPGAPAAEDRDHDGQCFVTCGLDGLGRV
ncbi:hypothetical protein C4901_15230 [Acidiferrobacter sp. SPIII_3]|jgi:hypothetical protein|uniref:hypothetical protein n=1 Tax=Acidiferrobacter sp. SPIII_3 TaxID=1281578 RepID=UPI000D72E8F8|nr:hypothetical protein [Acidiferrobacter sp. SPIII_3]AWP24509.1 hypothetical protein C4901_15230 [Acidiferrobacter sp. SPIII_3]